MRILFFAFCALSFSLPIFAQLLTESSILEKECDSGSVSACWKLHPDLAKNPEQHFIYSKKLCDLKDDGGCLQLAFSYVSRGDAKEGIRMMSVLCKKKYATSCKNFKEFKALLEQSEKPVKDENEYQEIISSWSTLNTKDKISNALKKLNRLCKIKHSNSCENRDILKLNLADIQKAEAQSQNQKPLTLEAEISKCENGDGNTCWGLYVANKNNQYGYTYLRNACLFGHAQACKSKKVLDDEQKTDHEQRMAILNSIQQSQPMHIEKSVPFKNCGNKNYYHLSGGCDAECPRYQECLEDKSKSEKMYAPKKRTTCNPDYLGGFTCTEN